MAHCKSVQDGSIYGRSGKGKSQNNIEMKTVTWVKIHLREQNSLCVLGASATGQGARRWCCTLRLCSEAATLELPLVGVHYFARMHER